MAKGTVAFKFTGNVADLKRATGEAERELEGFGSRLRGKIVPGMAVAGAAVGAALVDGLRTKIERDSALAVEGFGLSPSEARDLGRITGEVYGEGIGESFEQVADAAGEVLRQLGGFMADDVRAEFTGTVVDIAKLAEVEVGSLVDSLGFMLRNGLASDATEALDLITVALQGVSTENREEILAALDEYSGAFAALGLNGAEALSVLVDAGQETSVGIDKVGDAVKEFLIRASDGSKATSDALRDLGLDAGQVASDLAGGGDAARDAFDDVVDALEAIEDPAARAQLAVALFGTPVEDLAVNKIPDLLEALGSTSDAFGDVEGASAKTAQALDGDARQYSQAMRTVEAAQQELVVAFVRGSKDVAEAWQNGMRIIGSTGADTMEAVHSVAVGTWDGIAGAVGASLGAIEEAGQNTFDSLTLGIFGSSGAADDLAERLRAVAGLLADIAGASSNVGAGATGAAGDAIGGAADVVRRGIGLAPTPNPTGRRSGGSTVQPRAQGGNVSGGSPYMVGERGVELFVPRTNGSIVPAGEFGGTGRQTVNITINNPTGTPSEDSVRHELRRLQLMAI